MNTIYYPAIFHPEDVGYSVSVPVIDGCFSQGDTFTEACDYIKDAIGLCLEGMEQYPQPDIPGDIRTEENDFVVLIEFNRLEYRKRNDAKAVKKTLTIPSWLNRMAEERHVNFSGILQDALKEHLHID